MVWKSTEYSLSEISSNAHSSHGNHGTIDTWTASASDSTGSITSLRQANSAESCPNVKRNPPDGGWGWVVVMAAFAIHIVIGQGFGIFSMIYIELVDQLDGARGDVGWIGSIYGFSSNLAGLPASIVIDLHGCRIVAMTGGCIAGIGFFLSAFAPNVTVLYLTYGVFAGAGMGTAFFTCMVMVQHYFHRRRALAAGLCLAGLSVGTITSGPLIQFLIEAFGWRGALMVISGIALHIVVLAGLFRPVSQYMKPSRGLSSISSNENKHQTAQVKKSACHQLKHQLGDWSVVKDLRMALLLISGVLLMLSMPPFYSHTPSRAYFFGVAKQWCALLPTVTGIATFISRISFAFIANLNCVNRMLLYGTGILAFSVCLGLYTLAETFMSIAVFCFILGAANGCYMSVQATALADMVGVDKFPRAQGLVLLASGVGGLVSTPLIGYIFDITQDYNIPFYFAAVCGLLCGLLATSVALYDIYRPKQVKGPV